MTPRLPEFLKVDVGQVSNLSPPDSEAQGTGSKPVLHPSGSRKELAQWLTRPDHPLTARVMVNRIWQWHFGRGIVATPNDFGQMGVPPTHPELLDGLATEFVARGWSIKSMHRLIMTSRTYRQASDFYTEKHGNIDPDNTLLWRMNRRRLEGEAIWDAIHSVAGTINLAIGGRPVMPPLLAEELTNKSNWVESQIPSHHTRRGLYIIVRRNFNFPLFDLFDAPVTAVSCSGRDVSTVAPQALWLLNNHLGFNQAKHFSSRAASGVSQTSVARTIWPNGSLRHKADICGMRQRHAQGTLLDCFAIIACLCATVGRAEEPSGNLGEPIDRHALVTRHNVHIDKILPMSPLHLGNGSMVFTADFTGLQTFYHHYDRGLPLQTVAGWAWNQFPNEKKLPYTAVMHDGQYQGRPFKYIATKTPQQVHYCGAIHRFNLARIGLDLKRENGKHMFTATLADIDQQLNLWNGSIQSRFTFDGKPVEVHTVVHPDQDVLAIRLKSPMVREGRCNLKIEFPYPRGSKDLPTDYFERSMLPNWFQPESDGWQLVDAPFDVNVLGSDIPFRVYRKRFNAGTYVFGGNNWPECQVRSNVFPLFGDPDGGSAAKHIKFEVSTDKNRYRLVAGGVKKGQPVWTDRDYAISNVSESLRGLDMIMVCNVDEKVCTNEHFRITIDKPLDIYMAWQWHPNRHTTEILHQEFDKTDIRRTIDGTSHHVSIQHSPGISVTKAAPIGRCVEVPGYLAVASVSDSGRASQKSRREDAPVGFSGRPASQLQG